MTFLQDLFHNPVFMAPALSWLAAQVLKTIIYALLNRDFKGERLFGGGGMPSSHSATVCSLATVCGCVYGAEGFAFPLSFFFAFIVMYDAIGVRRETGRQAVVINNMVSFLRKEEPKAELKEESKGEAAEGDVPLKPFNELNPEEQLKELIGHSPLQVAAGAVIGIAIGLICVAVI